MLLNEKLTKMFNEQINQELYSAYLYLEFASYFQNKGLKGFAHWYKIQAKEELVHAEKFFDYMLDQGRTPELRSIDKPYVSADDDLAIGRAGLAHEVLITGMINKIYELASSLKDYRTMEFLNWFVKEQNEEEANACDMLTLLKQIDGNKAAVYFADMKMGEREK